MAAESLSTSNASDSDPETDSEWQPYSSNSLSAFATDAIRVGLIDKVCRSSLGICVDACIRERASARARDLVSTPWFKSSSPNSAVESEQSALPEAGLECLCSDAGGGDGSETPGIREAADVCGEAIVQLGGRAGGIWQLDLQTQRTANRSTEQQPENDKSAANGLSRRTFINS